jgi:hypothetical protein
MAFFALKPAEKMQTGYEPKSGKSIVRPVAVTRPCHDRSAFSGHE